MNKTILIVGAGLFGATCAQHCKELGYNVVVCDKRKHIGGICYTEPFEHYHIHKFGAHIFRTNSLTTWKYVNQFATFIPYVHTPIAIHRDRAYNLPFNMNTFAQLFGVTAPTDAMWRIEKDREHFDHEPQNLEEYCLATVGRTVYTALIRDFTEKQWGVPCTELPPDLMRRIPIRFTYNNNYYEGKQYCGIPLEGYTHMIGNMLAGCTIFLNTDGKDLMDSKEFDRVIYTGPIDELMDNCYGELPFRRLSFHEEIYTAENVLGVSVVNWSDKNMTPTRSIEHKHFLPLVPGDRSVVTDETPVKDGGERLYPMESGRRLYYKYREAVIAKYPGIYLGGRMGTYRYTDMEETITNAFKIIP